MICFHLVFIYILQFSPSLPYSQNHLEQSGSSGLSTYLNAAYILFCEMHHVDYVRLDEITKSKNLICVEQRILFDSPFVNLKSLVSEY